MQSNAASPENNVIASDVMRYVDDNLRNNLRPVSQDWLAGFCLLASADMRHARMRRRTA